MLSPKGLKTIILAIALSYVPVAALAFDVDRSCGLVRSPGSKPIVVVVAPEPPPKISPEELLKHQRTFIDAIFPQPRSSHYIDTQSSPPKRRPASALYFPGRDIREVFKEWAFENPDKLNFNRVEKGYLNAARNDPEKIKIPKLEEIANYVAKDYQWMGIADEKGIIKPFYQLVVDLHLDMTTGQPRSTSPIYRKVLERAQELLNRMHADHSVKNMHVAHPFAKGWHIRATRKTKPIRFAGFHIMDTSDNWVLVEIVDGDGEVRKSFEIESLPKAQKR